ncbi:MAG: hypothetical protein LBJ48_00265 [Coriobacteriales bacterium]|nr:hypothetical protein [Coriobacteriales bacterium]
MSATAVPMTVTAAGPVNTSNPAKPSSVSSAHGSMLQRSSVMKVTDDFSTESMAAGSTPVSPVTASRSSR